MSDTGFEEWAVLVPLQDGSGKWRLYKDLIYHTEAGVRYIVPRGYTTDLASIPRLIWAFWPSYGRYTSAACLHDYFCGVDWISRKAGDLIFLEAMKHSNVPKWKRRVIYWAVRAYAVVKRLE